MPGLPAGVGLPLSRAFAPPAHACARPQPTSHTSEGHPRCQAFTEGKAVRLAWLSAAKTRHQLAIVWSVVSHGQLPNNTNPRSSPQLQGSPSKQCNRKAKEGSHYCWQASGMAGGISP